MLTLYIVCYTVDSMYVYVSVFFHDIRFFKQLKEMT